MPAIIISEAEALREEVEQLKCVAQNWYWKSEAQSVLRLGNSQEA